MKSTLPKVLHRIGGRPLLGHVLDTARALDPQSVLVVVRHERDLVAERRARHRARDRRRRPGRGARAPAAPSRSRSRRFPTSPATSSCSAATCRCWTTTRSRRLIRAHRESGAAATVLSAVVDDATGYGRVIRDSRGRRAADRRAEGRDGRRGIRHRDQRGRLRLPAPRRCARTSRSSEPRTRRASATSPTSSRCCAIRGSPSASSQATDAAAALGVNDRVQLSEAARILNARTVRRWQLEGAMILDPATTWIDVTATLAPDVTVLPNTHILRSTAIAEGATVGPDTSLVDCEVGENAVRHPHRRDPRRDRRGRNRRTVRLPAAGHLPRRAAARSARSSRRRTPRSASAARCRTCRTSATRRSARA